MFFPFSHCLPRNMVRIELANFLITQRLLYSDDDDVVDLVKKKFL